MSRYRFHKVFLLWVALGIVFPGAASLNAFDRIPRKWTEMTMDDIDPFPFTWGRSICKYRGPNFGVYPPPYENCELSLRAPSSRGLGYETLVIYIGWSLEEIPSHCKKICEGPDSQKGNLSVLGIDRLIKAGGLLDAGSRIPAGQIFKWFPPDQVKRILRDVVMKLELYAAPCNCRGQPVRPTGETPPRPRPSDSGASGLSDSPPEAEVPPSTIGTLPPHLLGQGEGRPGTTSSESRAMRRTSGGFPPGVKVGPLRIYPSAKGPLAQDARSYGNRFDDRVEYLQFGVDLTYPARTEPFPFELELVVLKDGQPHVKYTRGGYSLGWTKSWHEIGWGRASGGWWTPGSYRAELSVKGKVVATGTFQIVPSDP